MAESVILAALAASGYVCLTVVSRFEVPSRVRLGLALFSSAALAYAVTGRWESLLFFGASILLTYGTWVLYRSRYWWAWAGAIVGTLILLKLPVVATTLQGGGAIVWVGFSYLAFRLLHIIFDAQKGRLEAASAEEIGLYALHPTSLVAGPIARLEHVRDAMVARGPTSDDIQQGLWRILRGAFLKFVIANPLYSFVSYYSMVANSDRPTGIAWTWLAAYSLYLLADFAGYSDIAIGAGRLAGIKLPENFDSPYLSPNVAAFWRRWHISLSDWLRDYVFFPMARALLRQTGNRFGSIIQLASHLSTMIVCGLWHGLTWGYVAWGAWHGLGLFVYGQFFSNRRPPKRDGVTAADRIWQAAGTASTILFVMLGWVFFASPDLPTAFRILGRLFALT